MSESEESQNDSNSGKSDGSNSESEDNLGNMAGKGPKVSKTKTASKRQKDMKSRGPENKKAKKNQIRDPFANYITKLNKALTANAEEKLIKLDNQVVPVLTSIGHSILEDILQEANSV